MILSIMTDSSRGVIDLIITELNLVSNENI